MQFRAPYFLFAAVVITAASAFGDIVPVPNFSFQDSAPGTGNPLDWTLFSDSSSPPLSSTAFVVANTGSFVSGVTGSQFAAVRITNKSPVPAGGSLAGLVSGSLGTFAPDTTYVLTADTGLETSSSLLDVGIALGSGTFPGTGSPFASVLANGSTLSKFALNGQTVTLDTSASPSLVGKSIDVSLIFQSEFPTGTDALFDNVTLTSTADTAATPEPPFFGAIGLLGLGLIVRRFQLARAGTSRSA
jgi:hypothetical protein